MVWKSKKTAASKRSNEADKETIFLAFFMSVNLIQHKSTRLSISHQLTFPDASIIVEL